MLLALNAFLGVVLSKTYTTTVDGPSFSINTVGNGGEVQFNTTIDNDSYLGLMYSKEVTFGKDMMVFFAADDGYVSDIYIGKAERANPDFEMSFNKTWNVDNTNDYTTIVNKVDNTMVFSSLRQFGTNDP